MILHEMWKKVNYNYNIWYKLIISLRNIINIIFLEFFEKEPYKKPIQNEKEIDYNILNIVRERSDLIIFLYKYSIF